MCRQVLNDEWVSHPTFASEDSGFFTQKKNIYEEALHRSEEERHEYDFHLDAIARTIGVLDPLDRKSAQMSPEERAAWKLKPNFGGSGKAIHQRIIKKIYGREAGLEVIDAIQHSPGSAIPVVVPRLKQKEEEWKRAQREWNKVWREVDAHNYYKALDHQSITFKAADKKALTSKAFVSQIEAVMEEQMAKRAMLVDPLFARARPRHQLEFELADEGVLMDCLKLTSSFVARMGSGGSGGSGSGSSAGQMRMDAERKKSVELRLLNVVKTFFMLSDDWVKSGSGTSGQSVFQRGAEHKEIVHDKTTEGEAGDASDASGSNPALSGSRVLSGKPADLRKNLLKNEQAKRSRGQAGQGQSPSMSRLPSPTLLGTSVERELPQLLRPLGEDDSSQAMQLADLPTLPSGGEERRPNRRRSFFTNTWFYTLLRLIEVRSPWFLLIVTIVYLTLNRSCTLALIHSKLSPPNCATSKRPKRPLTPSASSCLRLVLIRSRLHSITCFSSRRARNCSTISSMYPLSRIRCGGRSVCRLVFPHFPKCVGWCTDK